MVMMITMVMYLRRKKIRRITQSFHILSYIIPFFLFLFPIYVNCNIHSCEGVKNNNRHLHCIFISETNIYRNFPPPRRKHRHTHSLEHAFMSVHAIPPSWCMAGYSRACIDICLFASNFNAIGFASGINAGFRDLARFGTTPSKQLRFRGNYLLGRNKHILGIFSFLG